MVSNSRFFSSPSMFTELFAFGFRLRITRSYERQHTSKKTHTLEIHQIPFHSDVSAFLSHCFIYFSQVEKCSRGDCFLSLSFALSLPLSLLPLPAESFYKYRCRQGSQRAQTLTESSRTDFSLTFLDFYSFHDSLLIPSYHGQETKQSRIDRTDGEAYVCIDAGARRSSPFF